MIRIETAQPEDIAAITEIEHSFLSPWSQVQIEEELHHGSGICLIACPEKERTVIAWCCSRFVIPEAELLKIAVSPKHHRHGIGTFLLMRLWGQIVSTGCTSMFLEVREKNLSAIQFYKQHGFHQTTIRKNYYSSPSDNGIVMVKKHTPSSENTDYQG